MSAWLRVWGPNLAGASVATGAATGAAACMAASHALFAIPLIATSFVAAFASIGDLIFEGPLDRRRTLNIKDDCDRCKSLASNLAAIKKDRDELREAIITLQLPESRP